MTYLIPRSHFPAMPSLLDDFFGEDLLPAVRFPRELDRALSPRCDLHESEDAVTLEIEAPGIPADKLDIQVDETSITVSGRIEKDSSEKKGKKVLRSERMSGSFVRSFRIPTVDPGKVTAEARDGIVTVSMPKAKPTARRIEIRAGK